MKSRTSIIVFSSIGVIFLVALVSTIIYGRTHLKSVQAKVVTPISQEDALKSKSGDSADSDGAVLTSFIPLLSTETLMGALTMDFDSDGYDDQVVAVRKSGTPYLQLIVGLYNIDTNTYERSAEISTEINKIRTFSFNAVDMIGNHTMSLVYQGIKSNGDSVMQIYSCKRRRGNVEIKNIGNFSSDGTIFIQQADRSSGYEFSASEWGAPHMVWVYSSDKAENAEDSSTSISQIQTEYRWDYDENVYVQRRQLRITGSRMAAKELSRIQNGNVNTFAQFLNGLWYKTSSSGAKPSYIYFNYNDKEVIFLNDDTEGVYSWEESSLRRSGIYLTTVNTIISSIKRRFDIMLTGVNEVSVHVHDNVGMLIKESNQWDGTYRKMSFQNTFGEEKTDNLYEEFLELLGKTDIAWFDDDGNRWLLQENNFKITGPQEENGIYVAETIGGLPVVQFRSKVENGNMNISYSLHFEENEVEIPAKRRGQKPTKKIVINKDIIRMEPVKISAQVCYEAEGKIVVLRRKPVPVNNK